ncbi:hypothetical protein [Morganella morganii]|uniref:hypothetical protein n=1 Tax=Morganella morganii TaxID=582 RepID=UPI001299A0C3|nr:hypothetical protein [Morganella morganii]MRE59075.1 hypothetical protein [Morganella morganii]HDU8646352.1 hypothetical protein [Morganella morganii subsp. morganii]
MKSVKNKCAIALLDHYFPELSADLSGYNVAENNYFFSVRVWIKNEIYPDYIIFEKCDVSGELYLIKSLSSRC